MRKAQRPLLPLRLLRFIAHEGLGEGVLFRYKMVSEDATAIENVDFCIMNLSCGKRHKDAVASILQYASGAVRCGHLSSKANSPPPFDGAVGVEKRAFGRISGG